ncbi:hypothetical protein B0T25DRAFT_539038, partial [Lasiosphaeria hispida]
LHRERAWARGGRSCFFSLSVCTFVLSQGQICGGGGGRCWAVLWVSVGVFRLGCLLPESGVAWKWNREFPPR